MMEFIEKGYDFFDADMSAGEENGWSDIGIC
jgi:hypothetical protein